MQLDHFRLLLSWIDKLCLGITIIIVCRCVHTMVYMWTSEYNFQELVLSYYGFQKLDLGPQVFTETAFNP